MTEENLDKVLDLLGGTPKPDGTTKQMTVKELVDELLQHVAHGRGDKPVLTVVGNEDFKPIMVAASHSGDEVWIFCHPRKVAPEKTAAVNDAMYLAVAETWRKTYFLGNWSAEWLAAEPKFRHIIDFARAYDKEA